MAHQARGLSLCLCLEERTDRIEIVVMAVTSTANTRSGGRSDAGSGMIFLSHREQKNTVIPLGRGRAVLARGTTPVCRGLAIRDLCCTARRLPMAVVENGASRDASAL
jgi:hypothetical protein